MAYPFQPVPSSPSDVRVARVAPLKAFFAAELVHRLRETGVAARLLDRGVVIDEEKNVVAERLRFVFELFEKNAFLTRSGIHWEPTENGARVLEWALADRKPSEDCYEHALLNNGDLLPLLMQMLHTGVLQMEGAGAARRVGSCSPEERHRLEALGWLYGSELTDVGHSALKQLAAQATYWAYNEFATTVDYLTNPNRQIKRNFRLDTSGSGAMGSRYFSAILPLLRQYCRTASGGLDLGAGRGDFLKYMRAQPEFAELPLFGFEFESDSLQNMLEFLKGTNIHAEYGNLLTPEDVANRLRLLGADPRTMWMSTWFIVQEVLQFQSFHDVLNGLVKQFGWVVVVEMFKLPLQLLQRLATQSLQAEVEACNAFSGQILYEQAEFERLIGEREDVLHVEKFLPIMGVPRFWIAIMRDLELPRLE